MGVVSEQPGIADVAPGRLDRATLAANFADLHPPLSAHEAQVEADRCYFCYDAPCQRACPTAIDVPLFIRQIAAGNPLGAARTILDANIMGGMCARVCPTETLCEEACVREAAEGKPVRIGLLQRYAVDAQMATGKTPFTRAAPTGKRVAIVGAGPAGLACAHALAVAGHDVDDLRGAREARRAQRIRHRRLQDAGRFRRQGSRLHPVDRRHHGQARRSRSGATFRSRRCAAITTRCSSASASARPTSSAWPARASSPTSSTRSTTSPSFGRPRISPNCRSDGASSSSAAA